MPAVVFGIEHFLYIGITAAMAASGLLLAKKYAKSDKAKTIFMKALALGLLITIIMNRLSQVFRYDTVRWEQIIPDSYCGMTSLVLSLGVLFGKKRQQYFTFCVVARSFWRNFHGNISCVYRTRTYRFLFADHLRIASSQLLRYGVCGAYHV